MTEKANTRANLFMVFVQYTKTVAHVPSLSELPSGIPLALSTRTSPTSSTFPSFPSSAARQRAAQEARQKIAAGVDGFVRDAVASLREQTAQLCDDMLASFNGGKTGCHQRTLNRLVEFIDQFKALNFAGDRDLEARLDEVRRQFLGRTAEEYRDDDKARQRLTQGIANLADAARNLAGADAHEIVERFGQMGVRRFQLEAA